MAKAPVMMAPRVCAARVIGQLKSLLRGWGDMYVEFGIPPGGLLQSLVVCGSHGGAGV